jgi:cytochrome P450
MLRDPRVWGDDANTFKPERFLAEYNPKLTELPDIESLPFGFGRRYELSTVD